MELEREAAVVLEVAVELAVAVAVVTAVPEALVARLLLRHPRVRALDRVSAVL